MTETEVPEEQDERIRAFWNNAKQRAKLASMPGYFGPSAIESLIPPAWSMGESAEEADALVESLLAERRATMSAPLADYVEAEEPLPSVGSLGIVLDGRGTPCALVVTEEVTESDGHVVEVIKVLYAESVD